mgnify:CR=1 FL=1
MNEYTLKQLISKLTGVELVRTGMARHMQGVNIKNRMLEWKPWSMSGELPNYVKQYIDKRLLDWETTFGDSVAFALFAIDPSVTDEDLARLDESNHPRKDEIREVVDRIVIESGIPLLQSKTEASMRRPGIQVGGDFNGSESHAQAYGWAWGAEKAYPDEDTRQVKHLTQVEQSRHLRKAENYKRLREDGQLPNWYATPKVFTPVVAPVGGGFGLFLKNIYDDTLMNIISPSILALQAKLLDKEVDDLDSNMDLSVKVLRHTSTINTFFANTVQQGKQTIRSNFAPGRRMFLLDSPNDPNPKPIYPKRSDTPDKIDPVFQGRTISDFATAKQYKNQIKYTKFDDRLYILKLKLNGLLFWENVQDPSKVFNATEEQINTFNCYKGRIFQISNFVRNKYKFTTYAQKAQYEKDCNLLNEFRDFIRTLPESQKKNDLGELLYIGPDGNPTTEDTGQPLYNRRRTDVPTNNIIVLLISPRFSISRMVGKNQAEGRLLNPNYESDKPSLVWHRGRFTAKREVWSVCERQYSISRLKQQRMQFTPMNTVIEKPTCKEAVEEAKIRFRIPDTALPTEAQIQAAQTLYDKKQAALQALGEERGVYDSEVAQETSAVPEEGMVADNNVDNNDVNDVDDVDDVDNNILARVKQHYYKII